MKKRKKFLLIPVILVLLALYYYVALPAINIHNAAMWKFIILIPVLLLLYYALPHISFTGNKRKPIHIEQLHKGKVFKLLLSLIIVLVAMYLVGSALSSPVINASKYQKLLTVEKGEFSEDIAQISYDQIPLLDKDSAQILGERKMGSLVDLASQFEVANQYTQINYNDNPVRVTPLKYAGVIKW